MNNAYRQTNETKSYPEEKEVRKFLKLLEKLVPELCNTRRLETVILLPLRTSDFYTRRQFLLIWDIYRIVLKQITDTAIQAAINYLDSTDEEEVMDYWASSLDRILSNLYRVFTQSSIESFLERFRFSNNRSPYGAA